MRLVTGVVGAGVASVIVSLALTLPSPTTPRVSGHVRCLSGNPVVGIWVEAFSGGRGWARLDPPAGVSARVSYQHILPNGGTYTLSVGCGLVGDDWLVTAKSGEMSGTRRTLICHDIPGSDDLFGRCI